LYQRADDQEATIVNRLDVFAQQTAPLIAFYDRRNLLVHVNSNQGVDQLVADIFGILNRSVKPAAGAAAKR
jgi:adenylate kinase